MKKIILYISFICLSSCVHYTPWYLPPARYYYNRTQNELTDEIRYYEKLLQKEQRKKYYNYGWNGEREEYYRKHLHNLYLQRSHNEYHSRYHY